MRRTLLTILPKIALSRTTGFLTRIPLPRAVRGWAYGVFAKRYGVELDQLDRPLADFRSFSEFFSRPLAPGARPTAASSTSRSDSAAATLVWPCDGRIVTAGQITHAEDGSLEIPQVKGQSYGLGEFLGRTQEDVARYSGGSQVTIYLAPGDYHRVHAPFAARVTSIRRIPGTLFPVNPPAVKAIPKLFVRNARVAFDVELTDGRQGSVVMVGALNVGDIHPSVEVGQSVQSAEELGRFGFGSTTVVVLEKGASAWPAAAPESRVLQGDATA